LDKHHYWPEEVRQKAKLSQTKNKDRSQKRTAGGPSQKEVSSEARQAIKDLFPAIPKKDLEAILKHSFDVVSTAH
jgi:hypothetical protein